MIVLISPEKQKQRKEICEKCEFYGEGGTNTCDFLPGYNKIDFTRRSIRFRCPLNKF